MRNDGKKVTMFKFPNDPVINKKWVANIPRKNFVTTKSTKICELHFEEENIMRTSSAQDTRSSEATITNLKIPKLRPHAVPTIFNISLSLSSSEDDDDVEIVSHKNLNKNGTLDITEHDGETSEDENVNSTASYESGVVNLQKKNRLSINASFQKNNGKQISYVMSKKFNIHKSPKGMEECCIDSSEGSDVEEVFLQDPLSITDEQLGTKKLQAKETHQQHSTIVVKKNDNKEAPTFVVIDSNYLRPGRCTSVVHKQKLPDLNKTVSALRFPVESTYLAKTPTKLSKPTNIAFTKGSFTSPKSKILPTLTDDMCVVEAPSFITPYVYEKPPVKELKCFIKMLENELQETNNSNRSNEKKDEDDNKDSDVIIINDNEKDLKLKMSPRSVINPVALTSNIQKQSTYFDSALGKFFVDIGLNVIQESIQADLLKQQKNNYKCESGENSNANSLTGNLQISRENNESHHRRLKKCKFCNFKTESALVMAFHLESPHFVNHLFFCNFCSFAIRSPHQILLHIKMKHGIQGRLESPRTYQCPNCPYEDNQKSRVSKHFGSCLRKFETYRNLEPPLDFEPPAKICKTPKGKLHVVNSGAAHRAMTELSKYMTLKSKTNLMSTLSRDTSRVHFKKPLGKMSALFSTTNKVCKQQLSTKENSSQVAIIPLVRDTQSLGTSKNNPKNSATCEICEERVKDMDQLRNHMYLKHKIKIHPKMMCNRPPLNCQKCQSRFFTDQGLERHLLGSHGLVTTNMQEAASTNKDAGRCPLCGRIFHWKLLNHVAHDHNLTLKPAHLSYKCTVCTEAFGTYKQFESHVYSMHTVVTKLTMDKNASVVSGSSKTSRSVLEPLKINDDISQPGELTNGKINDSLVSSTSTSKKNTDHV
ncbi:hypothetical protein FQA39_LY06571 [Lamprigera yunnana]|nr:hypothetical protein FQA39_LY06571 [Lamprigera yunnana]